MNNKNFLIGAVLTLTILSIYLYKRKKNDTNTTSKPKPPLNIIQDVILPPKKDVIIVDTERISKSINVKDFGAKGDGKTDDTISIKNAFSEAEKGLKSVYFPSGTYIVNTGFHLQDDFVVFGQGESSLLKLKDGLYPLDDFATQGAMFSGLPTYGTDNDAPFFNSGKTTLNLTIKDLAIDLNAPPITYTEVSNEDNTRPPMAWGIKLFNAVNCLIENVTIKNPYYAGIILQTTILGTETKNNTIKNCNIILRNWYQADNPDIFVSNPSCIGIQITSDCNYETNNGIGCYNTDKGLFCNSGAKLEINETDGSYTPSRNYYNNIIGNTITNGSHCISLSNSNYNNIESNVIVNGSNRGIILSSRSMHNTITKNSVSKSGSTGIHLCYGSSFNLITYNSVHSTRGGEGDGIKAYIGCNGNVIEYNVVYNCPKAGIRIAHGVNGNSIRYNNIIGSNKNDIQQRGIKILANSLQLYCIDKLQYGDQLTANDNVCTDNTISNVYIGITLGDEKGFLPLRYNNNLVNNNKFTNVTFQEDLQIMKTPEGESNC